MASSVSGCCSSLGWRRLFQSRNCQTGRPSSRAIWASGRLLVLSSCTACFLNSKSCVVRFGFVFVDMAAFLSQVPRPLSTLSGELHFLRKAHFISELSQLRADYVEQLLFLSFPSAGHAQL